MKGYIFAAGLCFSLAACNSGTSGTANTSDSTNHGGHTTGTSAADTGTNHMKAMHDAMNGMMQQMTSMQPTGDVDHDFAMMMKHHHQSAVDMARHEVAGGTDDSLKQMAQKMLDDQQKEISTFDQFLQGHQPSGSSDYGKRAMGMMTPMSDMKMEGGSLDAMFASMMIPHHQDGVKMAEAYLKVGKNADLKKAAQSIVRTQPQEVKQLQAWLNKHAGGGTGQH